MKSHAVSEDGTVAMVVFETADGDFAITLPVDQLSAFRSGVSQLIDKVGAARTGHSISRVPRSIDVGFSDDIGNIKMPNGQVFAWRDCVLMRFDGNNEDEIMYVVTKADGLALGDNLKKGIMPRLTPAERRGYHSKDSLKQKIIKP